MNKIELNNLPAGVKIISIIGIIIAVILFFIGIYSIISGYNIYPNTSESVVGIAMGLIILMLSIPQLIFCIFTLKRKNWARISLGIFALISGVGSISILPFTFSVILLVMANNENTQNQILNLIIVISPILNIIIWGVIIFVFWYLIFNKKVKEAFNKKLKSF